MKKTFYFVDCAPMSYDIIAVEEITVDMDLFNKNMKDEDEYMEREEWTSRIVLEYEKDIPRQFLFTPYRKLILDYDPYWIICVDVFNDEEYMKQNSTPEEPDYYS